MRLTERYSTAIHATSLTSDPSTYMSDTDVLGAMGLASKHEPLGAAIARLLSGGGAASAIDTMAEDVYIRSQNIKGHRLTRMHARDLAKAVLAWYRFGTCQPCGGTGYKRIANTPVNGDECNHCGGTGKIPFDSQFSIELLPLAQWLSSQIDRCQAEAGRLAMIALAPKLDL